MKRSVKYENPKTAINPRLILASSSPRRLALLKDLGLRFKAVPAQVNEDPRPGENPDLFCKRMAEEKAALISRLFPEEWVLGADTAVVFDQTIMGKPQNIPEAKRFLKLLSGKTHRVITGFCLKHKGKNRSYTKSVSTQVTFKPLSREEVEWYTQTGEPMDKAGAYAIQGKGAFCVKKIRGSYTNVVGLPVAEVLEALKKIAGFQAKTESTKGKGAKS